MCVVCGVQCVCVLVLVFVCAVVYVLRVCVGCAFLCFGVVVCTLCCGVVCSVGAAWHAGTCGRIAGTHRGVLNAHTEAF